MKKQKINFEKKGKEAKVYVEDNETKIEWNGEKGKVRGASNGKIYLSDIYYEGKRVKSMKVEENIEKEVAQMVEEAEEKKQKEEYAELYEEMKKIPAPENNENPDDEKCQEILRQQKKGYSGEECDGLNLAVESGNSDIRKKAQKHCDHEFETEYFHDYTQDSRKRLRRIVKCEKCGFEKVDVVEAKVERGWI